MINLSACKTKISVLTNRKQAMSDSYRIIQSVNENNTAQDLNILASMHRGRKKIFIDQLHYTEGVIVIGDGDSAEEHDDYDPSPDTFNLVHIDRDGEVDASARLILASKRYMLGEKYADWIEADVVNRLAENSPDIVVPAEVLPFPKTDKYLEVSRYWVSEEKRKKEGGKKAFAELSAATLLFALNAQELLDLKEPVQHCIALAKNDFVPFMDRLVGWNPKPMGRPRQTRDDISTAIIYPATNDALSKLCKKHNINTDGLVDFYNIRITFAQNNFSRGNQDDKAANQNFSSSEGQEQESTAPKRNGSKPGVS